MNILLTGGAGYIGSHTYVALAESSGAPEAIEVYFKDRGWDTFMQTTDSCVDSETAH